MRALLAFLRLSRPLFLYGGFAGVALGAAVARASGHAADVRTYVWAQALVTSFHLMVHYANDYFDRESDALAIVATRTHWSGGSGVLADAVLPPRVALVAAVACAVVGFACCLRFAAAGNPLVALLGGAIFAFAWAYSAPPLRLATRGLGELDAVLVVAVLVPCVGYAAFSGALGRPIFDAVGPCAVAMFLMMLCVEMPDAGGDAIAGKRTLVVRWTPSGAYSAMTGAGILTIALTLSAGRSAAGVPGMLVVLPGALVTLALVLTVTKGDRLPRRIALLGVALYAASVSGLAGAFALAVR